MAQIEWRYEATIDAPPDAVYGWLCDYREDDHARPAFFRGAGTAPSKQAPSKRTVTRLSEHALEIHDAWGRKKFQSTVTLSPGRHEVRIEGEFGYRATWTAWPEGTGTRLEVHGTLAPGGIAGLFMGLARKGFLRDMQADFKGHVGDLRESLRAG